MKSILCLIFSLIILSSCQVKKENLGLNLIKGNTYSQKFIMVNKSVQTINNQQMEMEVNLSCKLTYKVTDIKDSIYDLEVKYENVSMKMKLPNGISEFSSEPKDDKDIFSTLLACIVHKSFFIKMTKTGKIKEVKNIDSLYTNIYEKFPQLSDIQKQQLQSQLMKAYGEKAFIGNFEMTSNIFPDSKVSEGDKWSKKTQLESGMSGAIETTYELTKLTDSYCLISGVSKIETADKDAYIETDGMPVKYNMKGTMTSTITIDRKTGWVINTIINQDIKGTMQIKDNPKMPGGMVIPMTMVNEMTITK
jgi:hypothetical protein